VTTAFLFLVGLALVVAVQGLAAAALARLRRRARAAAPAGANLPTVSIIKPLCGLDAALEENLESFFRQDYPAFYEMVFSFASTEDPALAVARRVADRHPHVPAVFVVDPREPGLNAKVNRLAFGLARARGAAFLLADGDVRVPPDFLSRAAALLSEPSVGLVSHLFRAVAGETLGARIEALYLDGILRPGTAAVALVLGRPCVVGKAILLSRAAFQAIGGLAVLRDHLAEDFLLGELVAGAGYRVVLSPHEVETRLGARPASVAWQRHRRWAILRRRLGGASYAGEALSSPVPFVAGAVAASSGATGVVAAALLLWGVRIAIEAAVLSGEGGRIRAADIAAMPLRDLAAAALFWAGLFGRRTSWRGRRLLVGPRTLLVPQAGASPAAPALSPSLAERG
jgi:ceramide glucosyltransferase